MIVFRSVALNGPFSTKINRLGCFFFSCLISNQFKVSAEVKLLVETNEIGSETLHNGNQNKWI